MFTQGMAERLCERLAAGETLRAICRDDDMPAEATVRTWAMDAESPFFAQYTRAREIGYHSMFDHLLEIADTPQEGTVIKEGPRGTEVRTGDMIEHRRLQVDTRKWMLAKALPKVYGDKFSIDQTTNIVRDAVDRPPHETREQWLERRRRELATAPVAGHADG